MQITPSVLLHLKARPPPAVVSIDSGGHRARFLAKRDALVEAHMHLVPPIANHIFRRLPPSFDLDDLLATGYLALIHTATRYRPREHGGAPFSAFARPRIRGAILNSFRRANWEENTRPPITFDGPGAHTPEPATDPRVEINTSVDERSLRKRLLRAIRDLPANPRDRAGHFQSLAAKLAEIHEWRAAAGHVEAIAELRRQLGRAS
jgi:RNA polymerase sigma factor (sigma-70 family)